MIQDVKGHKTFWAKEIPILHNAENPYQSHNHADTLTVASWPINLKDYHRVATSCYRSVQPLSSSSSAKQHVYSAIFLQT